MTRIVGFVAGAVLLLALSAGCGSPPPAEMPSDPPDPPVESVPAEVGEATQGLEVIAARATLLPGVGAVYLTVVNHGPEDDRLLAVETASAAEAMIHETVEEDGVMKMVAHPEGYPVAAGDRLELVPGGRHVMLHAPTVEEGPVRLVLHFERGGPLEVEAPVVEPSDAMGHQGH